MRASLLACRGTWIRQKCLSLINKRKKINVINKKKINIINKKKKINIINKKKKTNSIKEDVLQETATLRFIICIFIYLMFNDIYLQT